MDEFLERYKVPKLTQEEIDNLNTPILLKKKLKKTPGSDGSTEELYQTFMEDIKTILNKFFQKIEEGVFLNSFYEIRIAVRAKLDTDITRKKTTIQYPS